jgi:hypothetical protein
MKPARTPLDWRDVPVEFRDAYDVAQTRIATLEEALREMVRRCPGGAEYGHGMSRTVVHADCCGQARAALKGVE